MTQTDSFSKSGLFEQALRRLLRPLVRALISQGVSAPALYRIVKQTYVQVAEEELKSKSTDSRISVMTGVHRKDVKEFRSLSPQEDEATGKKASMLATVVGRWMTSPEFLDQGGAPIDLPRTADGAPSFANLVQSVSRDVRPRTILDELERQNIISVTDALIRLNADAIVGSEDLEQKLHFFSHNVGDHMEAAVENLIAETPPHLERALFYNNLTEASTAAIEAKARVISQQALQDVGKLAAKHQSEDQHLPEATFRFRYGHFFFRTDEDDDQQGNDSNDAL